jgi:hypothetical protein
MNYFSDKELHLLDATDSEKNNMIHLRDTILNPVREAKGEIVCTSGHRNEEHNKAVGGAKLSHHRCIGGFAAADVRPKKCTLDDLFYFIKNNFDYAELILEWDQGVVHVSKNIDPKRNIKRTSIRKIVNGEKVYY